MRKIALIKAASLGACILLAACQDDNAEQPLRIGMIPDAGGGSASVIEKEPLADYLAQAMGREVELVIPTNYNATVEGLGNGSLDIAYLGGLTFVKAQDRYGVQPMVQRVIDQNFHSVFITRTDSGIETLADLPGHSFCFGDINSTSGHLMPRKAMEAAGITAEQIADYRHTGSHPATAQSVANAACDAGAMDQTVFDRLLEDGQINGEEVAVFHITAPFADYVWARRAELSPQDAEDFSQAMMALERGTHDVLLDILRGDNFVPASSDAYAEVRQVADRQGLL